MNKKDITAAIRFLSFFLVVFLCFFTLARVVFIWGFSEGQTDHFADRGYLLWVGFKNDIKSTVFLMTPAALLLLLRVFVGVSFKRTEKFFRICSYFAACYISAVILTDWGYYDYFGSRLNASVFKLMSSSDVVVAMSEYLKSNMQLAQ